MRHPSYLITKDNTRLQSPLQQAHLLLSTYQNFHLVKQCPSTQTNVCKPFILDSACQDITALKDAHMLKSLTVQVTGYKSPLCKFIYLVFNINGTEAFILFGHDVLQFYNHKIVMREWWKLLTYHQTLCLSSYHQPNENDALHHSNKLPSQNQDFLRNHPELDTHV